MVALRGVPQDYDHWAEDLGCTGWSWRDLKPWFLTVEDDADFGDATEHGSGGPIPLERPQSSLWSPWDLALKDAAHSLGYPACADHHAPGAIGFGPAALNIRDGLRVSTNEAYLEPARSRRNLRVRGDTKVDRIIFDGKRAQGVVTVDGEEILASHIVLCAGTIHSPAILLRSGVTNPAIGANLCEHAAVHVAMALTGDAAERARGARTVTTLIRYTSGMADAGEADMQVIPLTGLGTEPPLDTIGSLSAAVMHVYSRGRVTLKSNDPAVEPAIDLNLLTDERDLIRMRDGVRRIIELVRHPAVGRVAAGPLEGFIPGCDLDHPDRWDDWIHDNVTNYVHPAGTCRMGRSDDPLAVVDLDCTLIGHQGVTVVDASVLPDLPRANTHLTVVAVAERMASRLRGAILPALGARSGS